MSRLRLVVVIVLCILNWLINGDQLHGEGVPEQS